MMPRGRERKTRSKENHLPPMQSPFEDSSAHTVRKGTYLRSPGVPFVPLQELCFPELPH